MWITRRRWPYRPSLREKLILADGLSGDIRIVAGADISCTKGDDRVFAAVVLLDAATLEVIEEATYSGRTSIPYIPGLLSFREGPALLQAFGKLRKRPDVALFDGQGVAHPRGFGLAAHMGLLLDVPAIGCAKTRLIGAFAGAGREAGAALAACAGWKAHRGRRENERPREAGLCLAGPPGEPRARRGDRSAVRPPLPHPGTDSPGAYSGEQVAAGSRTERDEGLGCRDQAKPTSRKRKGSWSRTPRSFFNLCCLCLGLNPCP